jgi:hypothetical protein
VPRHLNEFILGHSGAAGKALSRGDTFAAVMKWTASAIENAGPAGERSIEEPQELHHLRLMGFAHAPRPAARPAGSSSE